MTTGAGTVPAPAPAAPGSAGRSAAVWQRVGPLLGLGTLIVGLSFASPHFLTVENLLNVLRQSSINAILALGQLLVIITAGIDLSIGSILGVTNVTLALLLVSGWHPLAACAAALGLGLGIGLMNGLLLTKLRLPHPFISTLGTMNVGRGAALLLAGGVPISGLPGGFREATASNAFGLPMPVLIAGAVYLAAHVFLTRTVWGRDLYAIGGNREAARLAGIPVERRLNLAYALSGLAAAVAAIVLAGRMNSGFPLAGSGAELDAIAAAIIGGASFFGGVGTVGGTLIGALIIGFLRNGLNLLDVSAYWQMIVIGCVIVAAVAMDVLRQRGLRA
ncbi:MAG TPA: ABC transporter permease [Vicinamibacterales bacterium]|nr:ABC transporter permease [Vicinamibacterales bacterium]